VHRNPKELVKASVAEMVEGTLTKQKFSNVSTVCLESILWLEHRNTLHSRSVKILRVDRGHSLRM
jgi:hypothetical protein